MSVAISIRKAITRDNFSYSVINLTALLEGEDNPPNGAQQQYSIQGTVSKEAVFLCQYLTF